MGVITVHSILYPPFEVDLNELDIEDVATLKIIIMSMIEELSSDHMELVLLEKKEPNGETTYVRQPLGSDDILDDSIASVFVLHPIHANRKRYMTPSEIEEAKKQGAAKMREIENGPQGFRNDLQSIMQILTQGLVRHR